MKTLCIAGVIIIFANLPLTRTTNFLAPEDEFIKAVHLTKRTVNRALLPGASEGEGVNDKQEKPVKPTDDNNSLRPELSKISPGNQTQISKPESSPELTVKNNSVPIAPTITPTTAMVKETPKNATEPDPLDLNNPAAMKRALIVFGGFSVLAVAYWATFGRKPKNNETNNTHNISDGNQFRYGVLQSGDRDENLELSRVPLTLDSEDDDDDMEIFDLGQKKKSLSYVNLQPNEEEIDLNLPNENYDSNDDKGNLLLDIEDGDTLINLQSDNRNKFVL